MKILISGGGTGGHIYPAIAIAEALKKELPEAEFLFVGAKGRMEMEKVPKAGYEIEGLWISGLQRRKLWKNASLPFKIVSSIFKSRSILNRFQPDVVIGVGGYASAIALQVAGWRKLPMLIHEQNSYAGKTNKMLAKYAHKICVAYDKMERFFPKEKIQITGNPIRQDILNIDNKKEEGLKYYGLQAGKKVLMVTGGSLGARTLNESMASSLEAIKNADVQLLWQAGKTYIEEFAPLAQQYPNIKVLPFLDRMDLAYAVADVVVARAGALTISELCQTGKAAILVPSPIVAEDHQTANAMALVEKQAAILVKDVEARQELGKAALELLQNESQIQTLANNSKQLAKPHAAEEIAQAVLDLIS